MSSFNITDIANAPFRKAAEMWLATRHFHLAPRTRYDYEHYIATLSRHFGNRKLSEITGDDVRAYQRKRKSRSLLCSKNLCNASTTTSISFGKTLLQSARSRDN